MNSANTNYNRYNAISGGKIFNVPVFYLISYRLLFSSSSWSEGDAKASADSSITISLGEVGLPIGLGDLDSVRLNRGDGDDDGGGFCCFGDGPLLGVIAALVVGVVGTLFVISWTFSSLVGVSNLMFD